MSDTRKLIVGIILVFIGLFMVLSSSQAVLPYIGGAIGVAGAALILHTLLRGNIH